MLQIEAVTDPYAQMLVQVGVMNVENFISLPVEDISEALNIDPADAQVLLDSAMKGVDDGTVKIATEDDEDFVSATATPAYMGSWIKT